MPIKRFTPGRLGLVLLTGVVMITFNTLLLLPASSSDCETYHLTRTLEGPISQDDPQLVKWVKSQMVPPSRLPYNISFTMSGLHQENDVKGDDALISPSQEFILEQVEELYGDGLNIPRIFLEAGAYDGEFLSNTLSLEYEYQWKGILVEANPTFFHRLLQKRRKSWAINACLNTKPYPSQENFMVGAEAPVNVSHHVIGRDIPEVEHHISLGSSRLAEFEDNETQFGERRDVQCIPFYTIMRAMGISHIDFLSLDVEGAELGILDTLPWDKISFSLMAIESKDPETLISYLDQRGYHYLKSKDIDHIFVSKTTLREKKPEEDT